VRERGEWVREGRRSGALVGLVDALDSDVEVALLARRAHELLEVEGRLLCHQ